MKLIIYMLKKFFGIFIGAMFFFVLVLSITDLLMNLWNYISRGIAPKDIYKVMILYVPKTIWYATPIAMLFATAYMLSDLYAKNELLAVFASGVSLFKFAAPLLLVAFGMSIGMFLFEDNVVVDTYAQKLSLQSQLLQKEKSLNNDNIVIIADEGRLIYKAEYYDDQLQRLFNVNFLFRDEEKNFKALIVCDNASWVDEKWQVSNGYQYKKTEEGDLKCVSVEKDLLDFLVEPPSTFRNNTISVESVNTETARNYIHRLEVAGLPSSEAKAEYYKKFAFPFVCFIVVFLAIGLSGKTRKNVLIISLGLSITAVVLFYIMQMVTMLMAKFATIPPVFGAWFPVVFFIFVSVFLLKYAKT